MRTLELEYQEDTGTVSRQAMTRFEPFNDEECSALPTTANYFKPMRYDRIVNAWDIETGEVVDIRELCGGPPLPGPIWPLVQRRERPRGKGRGRGPEELKKLRAKDARDFHYRYRMDVIWNHYRNRLLSHFNGRCFACNSPRGLYLDHHVPLAHGGRRKPGNIVILCHSCNTQKCDYLPHEFYSAQELERLVPLLAGEEEVLAFRFDFEQWESDRAGYLLGVGISPLLVHEVTTNPDHIWHVSLDPPGCTIAFSVDLS
jgi:hypothetical protein